MTEISTSVATSQSWSATCDDPPDLEQVFDRFVEPVHRFLYSRVGNREDAEDLTSEVFLKAARLLDRKRPEASVAQWLFTVARTVLADHWRRYYRDGPRELFDEQQVMDRTEPGRPSTGTSQESARLVRDVLKGLAERPRQVLELRFLRGYTVQETADELGITAGNVKVIQHRALARAVGLAKDMS